MSELTTAKPDSALYKTEAKMLITDVPQGVPCWFELASTSPQSSFDFYHDLFGWERTDMDLGPMGTYSFLANTNGTIGAFCGMPPDLKSAGATSYWGVYFAVDNCDVATNRAAELGGLVVMSPMDVSEHGRMSVVTDPTGATFCLWQSKSAGEGNFVMFEEHAIGWVELATRDTTAAKQFYASLLGWNSKESSIPNLGTGNYIEVAVGSTRFGGILPMNHEWGDIPPHWGIYIMVPDVDRCVARAKELGGQVPLPPFDAEGVGRISMVTDPTGANCYVITLKK